MFEIAFQDVIFEIIDLWPSALKCNGRGRGVFCPIECVIQYIIYIYYIYNMLDHILIYYILMRTAVLYNGINSGQL